MTREALHLKNKKNRLWRRYLATNLSSDHVLYCQARNSLRNLTRTLRKTYEEKLIDTVKSDPKPYWKYVNSHLKI